MTNEELDKLVNQPEPTEAAPELPVPPVLQGELRPGDIRIYLSRGVSDLIRAYAGSDTTRELGGVLLGKISGQGEHRQLTITGAVAAPPTGPDAPAVSFTPEAWEQIYREKEARYPAEKIVGWFLTHPGSGLSLTNYDISLAKYYFTLPWQVAYVIDPVQQLGCFYQWVDERYEPCAGFLLFDEINAIPAIPAEPGRPAEEVGLVADRPRRSARKQSGSEGSPRGHRAWPVLLNIVLLLVVAALLLNQGRMRREFQLRETELEGLAQEAYSRLAGAYVSSDGKLTELSDAYQDKDLRIAELTAQVSELTAQADEQTAKVNELTAKVNGLTAENLQLKGGLNVISHTVKKGETLSAISLKYYGTRAKYTLIMSRNGITDPNKIRAGDVLQIYPE